MLPFNDTKALQEAQVSMLSSGLENSSTMTSSSVFQQVALKLAAAMRQSLANAAAMRQSLANVPLCYKSSCRKKVGPGGVCASCLSSYYSRK
jgi:hypothetical protein